MIGTNFSLVTELLSGHSRFPLSDIMFYPPCATGQVSVGEMTGGSNLGAVVSQHLLLQDIRCKATPALYYELRSCPSV